MDDRVYKDMRTWQKKNFEEDRKRLKRMGIQEERKPLTFCKGQAILGTMFNRPRSVGPRAGPGSVAGGGRQRQSLWDDQRSGRSRRRSDRRRWISWLFEPWLHYGINKILWKLDFRFTVPSSDSAGRDVTFLGILWAVGGNRKSFSLSNWYRDQKLVAFTVQLLYQLSFLRPSRTADRVTGE